jgi:hypothetical protein
MSDTPRTDEVERAHGLAWFGLRDETGRAQDAATKFREIARTLERELAAARMALDAINEASNVREGHGTGGSRPIPRDVFDALIDWTGAEPSQSVLALAVDAWSERCGDGCQGCPKCWSRDSTTPAETANPVSRAGDSELPAWLAEGERILTERNGDATLVDWDEWWKRHGSDTLRMAVAHYRAGGRPAPNLVTMSEAPVAGDAPTCSNCGCSYTRVKDGGPDQWKHPPQDCMDTGTVIHFNPPRTLSGVDTSDTARLDWLEKAAGWEVCEALWNKGCRMPVNGQLRPTVDACMKDAAFASEVFAAGVSEKP